MGHYNKDCHTCDGDEQIECSRCGGSAENDDGSDCDECAGAGRIDCTDPKCGLSDYERDRRGRLDML